MCWINRINTSTAELLIFFVVIVVVERKLTGISDLWKPWLAAMTSCCQLARRITLANHCGRWDRTRVTLVEGHGRMRDISRLSSSIYHSVSSIDRVGERGQSRHLVRSVNVTAADDHFLGRQFEMTKKACIYLRAGKIIQVESQWTMRWFERVNVADFRNGELGWGQAGSIERYQL